MSWWSASIRQLITALFSPIYMMIDILSDSLAEAKATALYDNIDFAQLGKLSGTNYAGMLAIWKEMVWRTTGRAKLTLVETLRDTFNTMITGGYTETATEQLKYNINQQFPITPLDPSSLAMLANKQYIDTDTAIIEGAKFGFDAGKMRTMINLADGFIGASEVQAAWLRKLINTEQAKEILTRIGLRADQQDIILQLAYYIPPPQDLITMAVREVFSPAIAEKFGQYEDFPADFAKWAQMQGVSEEWARKYWAAHWDLPSLQMGYEMLHRRIITKNELNVLLRAQDVMPFWRDKLTEMSYSPYTRVDVRRMHELGVLDYNEVLGAYQDIGYDVERATKLADWTELEFLEEGKTAVKKNILSAFKRGMLSKSTARNYLIAININPKLASEQIERAELEDIIEEKKEKLDLIKEQYVKGIINSAIAQQEMGVMGLAGGEITKLINRWDIARHKKSAEPSVADIHKFAKESLLEPGAYAHELAKLGFAEKWIKLYVELYAGKAVTI